MAGAAPYTVILDANVLYPDCLVTGYEPLVDSLQLPDADDRHVLAAAVVGHADAIVTFNRKDFPPEVCSPFSVEVQSADEFLVNQITLQKLPALAAIRRMRERWERPEVTAAELIDLLAIRGLGMTAACLADAVDLL